MFQLCVRFSVSIRGLGFLERFGSHSRPTFSSSFRFSNFKVCFRVKVRVSVAFFASGVGCKRLGFLCSCCFWISVISCTVCRLSVLQLGLETRLVRLLHPFSFGLRFCSIIMPVDLVKDAAGMEKIVLREPQGASVVVYLYGGQVTSWKSNRGEELLFLSSKATFKPPKTIRGGIPICFPQFSNLGSLEQHGLARNRIWSIDPNPPPPPVNGIKAFVDLILKPSEDDMKIWPHCFELRLRVALGVANLTLTSRIRNIDTKPFSFTFALHTYFSVSDVSEVRVEGLETLDYLDNLQNRERFTEQGDAITFDAEVDRVYLSTPTKIAIIDHEKKRTFVLRKEGLSDAVVWNPWDKKSRTIPDLSDEDYKRMVCVEAAAVEKPITLKPGEEWKGRQEITAVSSSYCSGQLDPYKVLNG